MIKHFLNRWYIRVQRKKPQTAKYSLYVWSLRWLWYIFAKIKTKITMPCEDFYTILIKQMCNFQAEYSIKLIETSIFYSKVTWMNSLGRNPQSNFHIVLTKPNFIYKLAILLEFHQAYRIFVNSFCGNFFFFDFLNSWKFHIFSCLCNEN